MNKIIQKQLSKVKSVNLDYNDDTLKIVIPKTTKILSKAMDVGKVYLIELDDTLNSDSEISSGWNNGKFPSSKFYIAELLNVSSNMYKFNGVAKDNQLDNWFGWLPGDRIKVLEKL